MKKAIAVMMILAGSLAAAPRVTFGIGFGAPAPVAVVRPACPGPGYTFINGYYAPNGVWVAGYWTWNNNQYLWVAGHWQIPPQANSVWVPPHWQPEGGAFRFYEGYWN